MSAGRIVALTGGVGGAKLCLGLHAYCRRTPCASLSTPAMISITSGCASVQTSTLRSIRSGTRESELGLGRRMRHGLHATSRHSAGNVFRLGDGSPLHVEARAAWLRATP